MLVVVMLLVWFALSIPAALICGRILARLTYSTRPTAPADTDARELLGV